MNISSAGMNDSETLMHTYLTDIAQQGNLDLIASIAHEDMVDEANQAFGGPAGRAGLVAHVKGFRRNVSHAELQIHKIVGNEQEVMAWWSFAGQHVGPWLNVEPTNETITGSVFSFFELEGGLIRRYRLWLHADFDPPVIFDSRIGLQEKS